MTFTDICRIILLAWVVFCMAITTSPIAFLGLAFVGLCLAIEVAIWLADWGDDRDRWPLA